MEHGETAPGNAAFGSYLRRVREGKRLSLDAVEELSAGFPEKVTKSHLSRIENGLALPSFPRLMALSHIYGMPIASLAERYELDLRRGMAPVDLGGRGDEEVLKEVEQLRMAGRYPEALVLLLAILDRGESASTPQEADIRLQLVYCLYQTRHLEMAKSLCEDLLGSRALSHVARLRCLHLFALCCRALGRYAVALMALDRIGTELEHPETPARLAADVNAIRGGTYLMSGDPARAIGDLIEARNRYWAIPNALESCRTGLLLSEALIGVTRYDEASKQLQAELVVAERHGFDRHRATAFSHLCLLEYRLGNVDKAEGHAIRSNTLARPLDHVEVVFRNCYYLLKIAQSRGDLANAKANERTLRSMLGRMESQLSEVQEFREYLAQGDDHEHR